jgi:hypothetical protein
MIFFFYIGQSETRMTLVTIFIDRSQQNGILLQTFLTSFLKRLVAIGQVVSEEKIEI